MCNSRCIDHEQCKPEKWYPLLAFAHLEKLPVDASPQELDPQEEVARQAEKVLGPLLDRYNETTKGSGQAVPHGGDLTFVPAMPGVEFNPLQYTFRWHKNVHSRVRIEG